MAKFGILLFRMWAELRKRHVRDSICLLALPKACARAASLPSFQASWGRAGGGTTSPQPGTILLFEEFLAFTFASSSRYYTSACPPERPPCNSAARLTRHRMI